MVGEAGLKKKREAVCKTNGRMNSTLEWSMRVRILMLMMEEEEEEKERRRDETDGVRLSE